MWPGVALARDHVFGFRSCGSAMDTDCAMNTDSFGAQQYAFTSNSSIPVLGDTVYANTNCSVDVYPTAGFYVVDPTAPATANPKNWVEIGALGIVINSGTC